jgi:hypothetical protein
VCEVHVVQMENRTFAAQLEMVARTTVCARRCCLGRVHLFEHSLVWLEDYGRGAWEWADAPAVDAVFSSVYGHRDILS